MLKFDESTLFFKLNSELVRQYKQTEQMLEKRESAVGPVAASTPNKKVKVKITFKEKEKITESVRANLRAQVSSLFQIARTKEDGHYKYLDFLVTNLAVFEELLTANKKGPIQTKEDLDNARQIDLIKKDFKSNQPRIFHTAHLRTLTKQDIQACGSDVNSFYAGEHDAKINIFKYDSLLHYVARLGDAESVRVLIEAGAKVDAYKPDYNYRDKKNSTINTTALGIAIASDNTRVARVLLEAGASIDMNEYKSSTNMHKITDNIKSDDMRALLVEFSLARMRANPFGANYSFTEQVLMTANANLQQDVASLHKKVDELINLVHKRPKSSTYKGPGLFDEAYQAEEPDQEQPSQLKRNKMSDVD